MASFIPTVNVVLNPLGAAAVLLHDGDDPFDGAFDISAMEGAIELHTNLLHLLMASLGVQDPRFHFTSKKPEGICILFQIGSFVAFLA